MAWLAWLVVHIFFLIGFRNRWGVFRQWAYTYLRFQDGVRLIVGSQDLPGWDTLAPSVHPMSEEILASAQNATDTTKRTAEASQTASL